MPRIFRTLLVTLALLSAAPLSSRAHTPSPSTHIWTRAVPSVVMIEMADSKGEWMGKGSGFIIKSGEHKYILTAGHCLRDPSLTYTIILWDGSKLPVLRTALGPKDDDVALAQVDDTKLNGCPELSLAEQNPYIGTELYVFGYPWTYKSVVETEGIVSMFGKVGDRDFMFSTAVIWHGNSGGPIIDGDCKVVGIVDAMVQLPLGQSPFYLSVPVEPISKDLAGMVAEITKIAPPTAK